MQNNTTKTIAALAAVAAVALAGCGDENGGGDAGTLTDEEYLGHQLRNVAADDAPGLDVDVEADDHGGWNVHIIADGFEFTPEQVNGDAAGGQGHAHVYVDDTKFSRVYSEYYHLPVSAVPEGEHTVSVTLNADDHSVWALDGEPITASVAVTGQEDEGHGHSHGDEDHSHSDDMADTDDGEHSDGEEPANDAASADHVFTYTIVDGAADPPLERHTVQLDSVVRIEVTSDVADELHMHGFDVTADVAAGETAVLEFTADQQGRFELEGHESGLKLLDLLVE